MTRFGLIAILAASLTAPLRAQTPAQQPPPASAVDRTAPTPATLSTQKPPRRADILRGEYGRYRANNDLLSYRLDVRVDPLRKSISGTNTIRFRMLKDDARIQLDLYANLDVEKILLGEVLQHVLARFGFGFADREIQSSFTRWTDEIRE